MGGRQRAPEATSSHARVALSHDPDGRSSPPWRSFCLPAPVGQFNLKPRRRCLASRRSIWRRTDRQFSAVVSEERYEQSGHGPKGVVTGHRVLRSDLLLINSGEAGALCFRDVYEVDGKAVRDRSQRLMDLVSASHGGCHRSGHEDPRGRRAVQHRQPQPHRQRSDHGAGVPARHQSAPQRLRSRRRIHGERRAHARRPVSRGMPSRA